MSFSLSICGSLARSSFLSTEQEEEVLSKPVEIFPFIFLRCLSLPSFLQIESRVDVSPSSLFVGPQSTGPGGTALGDLLQRILSVGSASTEGRRGAVVLQQMSCKHDVKKTTLLSSS